MVFTTGRDRDDPVRLNQDKKLTFGDDNDFKMLYDGDSLRLSDSGTQLAQIGKFGREEVRFTTSMSFTGNNTLSLGLNNITGVTTMGFDPRDVRNISNPSEGDIAFHDGSGNAGKGIAYFDGSNFQVLDGGTIP
jgi:hypothetical protein